MKETEPVKMHCSDATVHATVLNWHFSEILGWAVAHPIYPVAPPPLLLSVTCSNNLHMLDYHNQIISALSYTHTGP
jgi:hypothetical protein